MTTFKVICPLVNFQVFRPPRDPEMSDEEWSDYLTGLDVDLIFGLGLPREVLLRRFFGDDLKAHTRFLTSHFPAITSAEFALESTVRLESGSEFDKMRPGLERSIRNVSRALRLLKKRSSLASEFVFCFLRTPTGDYELESWSWEREGECCNNGPVYSFSAEDVSTLSELLRSRQTMGTYTESDGALRSDSDHQGHT